MHTTSISLLLRLKDRSKTDAWDRFVELYTPLLLYWGRRAGLTSDDAADLAQEVLLTLLQKLPEFDYDRGGSFRSWLRTVTMNKWRDRQRRNARQPAANCDDVAAVADRADDDTFWGQEHRQLLVRRALELMQRDFEENTWKACWQTVVESRPAREVACELGITENAVYIAKWRVLRHLRQELAGLLE